MNFVFYYFDPTGIVYVRLSRKEFLTAGPCQFLYIALVWYSAYALIEPLGSTQTFPNRTPIGRKNPFVFQS